MTTSTTVLAPSPARQITQAYVVLFIAMCTATFAAIFIRLSQVNGLPSLVIAAGRLSLAALIMTPIVWQRHRHELARLQRDDLLFAALAGIAIAVHFILLIISLEHASVLVSQVFTNTGPIWVAMLEMTFLKAKLPRIVWFGIVVALLGSFVIAFASGGDSGEGDIMLGIVLGIFAAIAGAIYLTIGRKVRRRVSVVPYAWLVFSFGGITASVVLLFSGVPVLGHPVEGYFWLVALTLLVQLVGHTGFNYAVGYLSATIVSLSSQIITVLAAIVAFFLFAEMPTTADFIGSTIIIIGVMMAIKGQMQRRLTKPQA